MQAVRQAQTALGGPGRRRTRPRARPRPQTRAKSRSSCRLCAAG